MSRCSRPSTEDAGSGETPSRTTATCPRRLLRVEWSPREAYCGDRVALIGTAQNMQPNTEANASITPRGATAATDRVRGTGQDTFNLPWQVHNVLFTGTPKPQTCELIGRLVVEGQLAETPDPLVVRRVPDRGPEAVSFHLTSGVYRWDCNYNLQVQNDDLRVTITLHIQKAWLGKWVSFDPAALPGGDGRSGWAFVKQDGATWKYWHTSSSSWRALPRNISAYTVNDIIFVRSGTSYVGLDDASQTWPEAFPEPTNYESRKTAWRNNIQSVWDNQFKLLRTDCPSSAPRSCCCWNIRVEMNWSETSGDKQMYAVWSQQNERSNARDWYLSDPDDGMAGHECGHLFGAYDEYLPDGALDPATNTVENDSIMGQNLTRAHERHFNNLRDQAASKINGWISRTWTFSVVR